MRGGCYPQILDMAHLFRGCFVGNRIAASLNDGIVQTLVTCEGIVVLLAAVVCLDYNIVRLGRHVARVAKLTVEGGGDMVQECAEGYSQSSFRIYSCVHVQYSAPFSARDVIGLTCSHSARPGRTTC